jgi:hypothetical protein
MRERSQQTVVGDTDRLFEVRVGEAANGFHQLAGSPGGISKV